MIFKNIWEVIKETFSEWSDDQVPKLAASLSFYTVFSITPLLLIAIGVAGLIFGEAAAQGEIVNKIEDFVGKEGAVLVQEALKNSKESSTGILATVIGLVTLLIGASAVFLELQDSLNRIWDVRQKPGSSIKTLIRNRLLSFLLVISMGILLFATLLISALITGFMGFLSNYLAMPGFIFILVDLIVSLVLVTSLFAIVFKFLPDVELDWKDVKIGAFVTALLFVLGKYLISLYLSKSSYGSTFGAAGSLALLLVWIYYSAQIVYLGAEFTFVYAKRYGTGIRPSSYAEKVEIIVK